MISLKTCVLLGVCALTCSTGFALDLQFDQTRRNQLTLDKIEDGSSELRTTGNDPFILLKPFDVSSLKDEEVVLAFEYFCPDGIDGVDVYFGPPINAENFLSAGSLSKAEGWQPFSVNLADSSRGRWSRKFNQLRIDFGKRSGQTVRVRNLVLRKPNAEEQQSQAARDEIRNRKQIRADIVTNYLAAEFPTEIESVVANQEDIRIGGKVAGKIAGELHLIEAQPWQELWKGDIPVAPSTGRSSLREEALTSDSQENQSLLALATTIVLDGSRFSALVPRFDGERDRVTSRWGVVSKHDDGTFKRVSHYVYPTDLTAACEHPDLDRKIVDGVKGMGGVWANDILAELVELGVKHITDNMWLSTHFSADEKAGWTVFHHNGKEWWVNPAFVHGHDRLIKFATDNDMIVSAIVLVGFGNDGFAGTLQHPDADRAGEYAMPDLTTPEGVAAYEAAIHFVAKRYAQPGDPHGRISNWIMHNEVDYGWVWTNMGEQPLSVFLDTYIRSMRIVHNIARQFNPHARTFISLTHNWHKADDPAWKTYAPKKMLEMLSEFSRAEGDFEWGVAYHPYPQSLFKADAWNDTRVTDDFDTPLITPKNLAVLDRWMQREEMLFQGKPRGVMLSEQGFHTHDYSEESQRLQAAAFLYMWRQMRGLKSVESFQNHRWVDHPREGGLKLGIRTLPSDGKPFGEKKYGWEVYKALDTPDETKFAEELNELIEADR